LQQSHYAVYTLGKIRVSSSVALALDVRFTSR